MGGFGDRVHLIAYKVRFVGGGMLEQPLCTLCAFATSWSTVFSCGLWFIVPLAGSGLCSILCQLAALPPAQLGVKVFHLHLPPRGCKYVLSEEFHTATTLNKSPALLHISLFFKKKIVVCSFHLQNSAGIFFEGSFRLYNMTSFFPVLSPSQTLSSTPLMGERE